MARDASRDDVVSILDDRGRLFGRINLVDAALAIFVLVAVPLAYGTWLLFHPRRVEITSVTRVTLSKDEQRISNPLRAAAKLKVKGRQFSPMLRAWIGSEPALGFMYEDPNSADVIVPPMPPGEYDVALYDGGQEVARAPRAFVVAARETHDQITAVGRVLDLDRATAERLTVGAKFPASGEPAVRVAALGPVQPGRYPLITGAGERVDVPRAGTYERAASLVLACDRGQSNACAVAGITLAPNGVIRLPGSDDPLTFVIDELLPGAAAEPLDIVVQFTGGPEVGMIAAGDRDQIVDDRAAVVTAAGLRQPSGALAVHLRIGADRAHDGWRYRGRSVKVGAPFQLTTDRYVANGTVASMTALAAGAGK